MQIPRNEFKWKFQAICKWAKKKYLGFGGNLGYRLHQGNISPFFEDLSSTTHVSDCVPR